MSRISGADAPWTPVGFISKWSRNTQNERQASQAHFADLCRLLDHPTPADDDPTGEHFAFEKAATRIGGGKGYADVWKKDYFTWEYKSRGANLDDAHRQLMAYAPALGNPPLQVVCDFKHFRIHTAWTNAVHETHELELEDFLKPDRLQLLRNVFHDPDKLRPVRVRSALTKEAADKFATIAVAVAANRLDELRKAWLNPPDLIEIVPEIVPGYPDRILPKNAGAAAELKKRTLTNLYNARPQWLDEAHSDLDAAVAAAYGWPADISEDDALAKLLELNLARAAAARGLN